MPGQRDIWNAIQGLDRLVFTTRELSALTGISISFVSQLLSKLEEKRVLKRVMQGIWAMVYDKRFSSFMLVPFLSPSHQVYVSFISAMHIYGIISQIPQMITVASTSHSKKVITPVGVYQVHQIEPGFFIGFDWHQNGSFLIATPEKALLDSLYVASRKGKRYLSFPELTFPPGFSKAKAKKLAKHISDPRLRASVLKKLEELLG